MKFLTRAGPLYPRKQQLIGVGLLLRPIARLAGKFWVPVLWSIYYLVGDTPIYNDRSEISRADSPTVNQGHSLQCLHCPTAISSLTILSRPSDGNSLPNRSLSLSLRVFTVFVIFLWQGICSLQNFEQLCNHQVRSWSLRFCWRANLSVFYPLFGL